MLELFLQAGEEGVPWAELRIAAADSGPIANAIHLSEHIDDVEPSFDATDCRRFHSLRDAKIDLLVRRQGVAVGVIATAAQSAPGKEIDAEPRVLPEIGGPGGSRHQLIMVGVDGICRDE